MANDSEHHWYRFVDNGCIVGLMVSILLLANQFISGNVESLGIWFGILT